MPKFIEMTSAPWTKANFKVPPEGDAQSLRTTRSTSTQNPGSITVNVHGIMFTGTRGDYNPLFDRALSSKIEPPQWQKDPEKRDPISYVRETHATVKLDISGSSDLEGRTISVRVTPSGTLKKKTLTEQGQEQVVAYDPPETITFTPEDRTIQVTNWGKPDYEKLIFSSSALPDEIRLDELNITWCFEYRYPTDGANQWRDAGTQTTKHETYITYARPHYGFAPIYRP
ncbi:MAG: hypothetical protein OXI63_12995 [Candidatus Poribacteria bacterium]|nr:hypothetical protein [Candidatus Poribacteria bacterium]